MRTASAGLRRSIFFGALLVLLLSSCSVAIIGPARDQILSLRQPRQSFPDVVFANNGQADVVYYGSSAGFTESLALPTTNPDTVAVEVGDLNGDGSLDLQFAQLGQYEAIINNGAQSFTSVSTLATASTPIGLGLFDFENDNDIDIAAIGGAGSEVFRSTGGGVINDQGSTALGPTTAPQAIAIIDYDNNGFDDVIVADETSPSAIEIRAFQNVGTGFDPPFSIHNLTTAVSDIAVADVDGTNGDDLIVTLNGGSDLVLLGNGAGGFSTATPVAVDTWQSRAVAVGDINKDGSLDLVIATNGVNRTYLGSGTGTFTPGPGIGTETNLSSDVALVDADLDSNLDAIFAENNTPNLIYYGNGDGTFGGPVQIGTASNTTTAVVVGDFD